MSASPICFTRAYIWVLAKLYFTCNPGTEKTIRANIAKAIDNRTPLEMDKIAQGVLRGMVQHYQEKMLNGFFETSKLRKFLLSRVCFDGFERVLQDALKEGRGVIIASAHYGALEFLPRYLAVRKFRAATMAKFATERLKYIIITRVSGDGLDVIVPGDVKNVLHEASRLLSQNKIFVTQCDETDEWRPDPNYAMDFLGRKIHPDRMLNVLCKRTGAVLLFGLLHREGKNRYKLILHRVPDEGDEPVNVRTLKLLEKYIYRYPDQWYEWKKYDRFARAA
jgi:KDO2-lipid IV(A) lauroyltransferase